MKVDVDAEADALTKQIGGNARIIRETLGLSLRDAEERAAAVGYRIAYTFIGKLERGEKAWNMKTLAGLAATYGVAPEALLLPPSEQALLQLVRAGGPLAAITWARSQI